MNTIEELRKMAERFLTEHPRNLEDNVWGGNFKKLLEELSIYQIELEHQNKELARSECELAIAHEEYVKLFESTPVGYVILDKDRKIVHANKTFIHYFVSASINNSELEGVYFPEFVIDEFKNAFTLFCKMAGRQKVPVPIELKLRNRHGKSNYVLLSGRIYDEEKEQIAITASDISMQKRMEEQLARMKDEAQNADRKKSRFLTNVSHELRTPLSSIIGYGALIEDQRISDQEKRDFLKNIVTTCKMLLRFSDDVLDVSTLESGETPLRNQVVNIKALCENTAHLMSRKLMGKNVLLIARTDEIPMLWTDKLRIMQIIHSIFEHAIGNAVDGEIVLTTSFKVENSKFGTLTMHFSGNEIFSSENDFEQDLSHSDLIKNYSSLGLFLTQRIVKAMNGNMIWEHPLNTLIVKIPVEISPFESKDSNEETHVSSDLKNQFKKKCLLVDDVAMNLKVLGMMMQKLGFVPTLAMSALEALELLRKEKFDVILTDLWMPQINGEEFAMTIRQNPDCDNIPIFAVTADVENNNNFNMDFFAEVIIKPVSREKLQYALGMSGAKKA